MIILTVCNHKGGTGKTTTSMNIAATLGLTGKRVLAIDLDPQGFLTRMMGLSEPEPEESSLILFDESADPDPVPIVRTSGFDLLRSSPALSTAMRRLNKPTDVLWAKEFVQNYLEGYDMILFDTAAAVTVYSLNALVASQFVVIPVLPEYQPVLGAEQTYQTSMMVRDKLNPMLRKPYFLFTMVDGRKRNHYAYRRYIRERYGSQVLVNIIRTCTTLSTTRRDGKTVFEFKPEARGAIDYANTSDELMRRISSELRSEEKSRRVEDPTVWRTMTDVEAGV